MTESPVFAYAVDVSSRALVRATGKDVLDLLQRISTNGLAGLRKGESRATILLNEKGRMIEVLTILRVSETELLLAAESADGRKLLDWLNRHVFLEDARFDLIQDGSSHLLLYDLQQNDTHTLNTKVASIALTVKNFTSAATTYAYTDFAAPSSVLHVVSLEPRSSLALLMGKHIGTVMAPEQFEDHRIRLGIPAAGRELTLDYNPLEANLGHLVSGTKGCYTGQEVLARIDTYKKLSWKLSNLICSKYIDSVPETIFAGRIEVGFITSCARSAGPNGYNALGYIRKESWDAPGPYLLPSGAECRLSPHESTGTRL